MNGTLRCHPNPASLARTYFSLDAVDDLMNHPTVDDTFHKLAKKLPDLERIVSRIHAGSCKPKDFLKVLSVRPINLDATRSWFSKGSIEFRPSVYYAMDFRTSRTCLNRSLHAVFLVYSALHRTLARTSTMSKAYLYHQNKVRVFCVILMYAPKTYSHQTLRVTPTDSADLLPEEGKDEKYDEIQGEIDALESQLEQQLKKLQKSVGCVSII